MPTTAEATAALTLVQVTAQAASRIDIIMAAEAPADNTLNADATEVEAYVTTIAEASTALTPVQVAASRIESVMAADAATNNALNADATEVEAYVPTTAEASTALTLVQAAIASPCRVDSIMAAE